MQATWTKKIQEQHKLKAEFLLLGQDGDIAPSSATQAAPILGEVPPLSVAQWASVTALSAINWLATDDSTAIPTSVARSTGFAGGKSTFSSKVPDVVVVVAIAVTVIAGCGHGGVEWFWG